MVTLNYKYSAEKGGFKRIFAIKKILFERFFCKALDLQL